MALHGVSITPLAGEGQVVRRMPCRCNPTTEFRVCSWRWRICSKVQYGEGLVDWLIDCTIYVCIEKDGLEGELWTRAPVFVFTTTGWIHRVSWCEYRKNMALKGAI